MEGDNLKNHRLQGGMKYIKLMNLLGFILIAKKDYSKQLVFENKPNRFPFYPAIKRNFLYSQ
jgi:hypothetical protein